MLAHRPLVFTLGSSAVVDAGPFYENSVAATKLLGRRAVLLVGKDPRNRPASLPDGVVAFAYAPYSELFPRAAAIVHQGGIGTTAQAMRSGRPCWSCPTPTTNRTTQSVLNGWGSPAPFHAIATLQAVLPLNYGICSTIRCTASGRWKSGGRYSKRTGWETPVTPSQVCSRLPDPLRLASPRNCQRGPGYVHIEIGDQKGFGCVMRALAYGGLVFEDDKPSTLAEAMAALEKGLADWFEEQEIEVQ